ncbi:ComEC/Rec2 family competence protein [Pseudomonas putida]|uniref:ComEC/Rec2 family competence protein n=1 Tax=Pseudomonas putida TaxID=303 RepID=UPI00235DA765|nr:MBL fold metallo-hydrolase [Pseudomonas putida]GLO47564.1 hypothetical protein PPUN109347_41280 [Pseudomonas putida]HDS0979044.1 MBL fold metallo-hydrolase [Pseudomonas putida]
MAWSLEIHHIDVKKAGDATLIVAKNPENAEGQRVRAVLIDGGRKDAAPHVYSYITDKAGLAKVDAVVVTHYDGDHLGGVAALLEKPVTTFDTARVYDRGWPALGPSDLYLRYLTSINRKPERNRVTRAVQAADLKPSITSSMVSKTGSPAVPAGATAFQVSQAINQAPQWLLSGPQAELLQLSGDRAPTLTCIACNQWVQRPNGTPVKAAQGVSEAENACSLAFLLRFGEFTYYIGGDIEDPQEALIAQLANPNDDAAGRVLVVKASHHGADTATSAQFLQRMRPLAVMVSNSTGNQHGHPAAATVDVLNGYPRGNGVTPPPPPASPGRPRRTYFTGFDSAENMSNAFVTLGIVAGDPNASNRPGNLLVKVSEAQAFANRNFPASTWRAVLAIADIAAKAVGLTPNPVAAKAAAEAAVKGTLVDVVTALANTTEARDAATALWILRSKTSGGINSEYLARLSVQPLDQEDWLDAIDAQRSALQRAANMDDVYRCVDSAAQTAATASAAVPGPLAGFAALADCIDGLGTAYQLVNRYVPLSEYTVAAQAANDQATRARDILSNGAGRVAALATQAATAAQRVHGAGNQAQAFQLAGAALDAAEKACEAAGETFYDLGNCYKLTARAAANPSPALVGLTITRACGSTQAGVVTGAIAGAICGNGRLDPARQALHYALDTVKVNSSTALAALGEALTGGEPLFTVSYYKASANKDVQDSLS